MAGIGFVLGGMDLVSSRRTASGSQRRTTPRFHPVALVHGDRLRKRGLGRLYMTLGENGEAATGDMVGSGEDSMKSDVPKLSEEEKQSKARRAIESAERLHMEAERARIEADRAQLEAEKRRLELEKTRLLKLKNKGEDSSPLEFKPPKDEKPVHTPEKKEDPVAAQVAKPEEKAEKPEQSANSEEPKLPLSDEKEDLSDDFMSAMGPLSDMKVKRISREDIQTLRDHVFTMEQFYVTQVEVSTFGDRVVFRGNMRGAAKGLLQSFEETMEKYGLNERIRLFLMEDPAAPEENKPVFVALPKEAEPRESGVGGSISSFVFLLVSAFTTLGYGIGSFGFTPQFLKDLADGKVEQVVHTLPVSLGILAVMFGHEIGHRAVAALRGIKLDLPFFMPSLQTGTYGSITPLKSFPKSRSDFFDVAIAGPAVGLSMAMVAFIAGLMMTGYGEINEWYPQIPTSLLNSSMLIGALSKFVLPASVLKGSTLAVHPLTIVGCSGLLINAINLIPVGRLDGGRVVQALYGRIAAGRISSITLFLQVLGAILGNSPLLLYWGLIAVLFQSRPDIPSQDEVTEPDDTRSAIGLAALVLMVLILAPYPEAAQQAVQTMQTMQSGRM
ncbi:hypothetical protein NDN08_005093 [Rhodosorus marinus]|uniref:Peptidase M50 domain-containing protein n=2 Tax=Rhodosorus marinus TaxID=101924 RepID=A0AAV8V0W7_9RHOD|nr:hypothetical protein NDN08_005093 [Rhodosorus marinus]